MEYKELLTNLEKVSISILVLGNLLLFIRKGTGVAMVLQALLLVFLLTEIVARHTGLTAELNIYLIPVSGTLSFMALSFYLSSRLFQNAKLYVFLFFIGALVLLLLQQLSNSGTIAFLPWNNLVTNLLLSGICLLYLGKLMAGKIQRQNAELYLVFGILLFFSFDSLIALSFDFMVKEHLSWVTPFWVTRALLLQLFYISLINLVWKAGQTQILSRA